MNIPQLRTGEITLSIKHDNPLYIRPSHTVINEKGETVGIFFGRHAKSLAEFTTTWTQAMELAVAATLAEDKAAVKTEVSEEVPSGRGTQE